MVPTHGNSSMSDFPHPTYSQTVLQPAYDDAQAYLFEPMLAAHEAHAIMLAEQKIITQENARAILKAVAHIREQGVDAYAYQPGIEDLFFRIEGQIIEQVGPEFGGNLQLARSRNDLGQALARMALRTKVANLSQELLSLRTAVLNCANNHLDAIMPGYTHTQPAQPVTFAHYLAGVLTFLDKDQSRLHATYQNVNESPLGAAAFTGSGFPIDRERVAALLGFGGIIASTHHSIGAGDHLTDISFAIQSLAIGLSRVTKDLLFLATKEASAIYVDDSFIQISSIMPQKRNPVVLEHLRARLSRTIGYAQTVAIQCHNIPYGDTQDIEDEILPPLILACAALQECLILYTSFFETVQINRELMASRAADGFTTATELADVLVRDAGLPFRQAHKVVATMVTNAVAAEMECHQLTLESLQSAAHDAIAQPVDLSEDQFRRALDPEIFVAVRDGIGGVAPSATGNLLTEQASSLQTDLKWLRHTQETLERTNTQRLEECHRYGL